MSRITPLVRLFRSLSSRLVALLICCQVCPNHHVPSPLSLSFSLQALKSTGLRTGDPRLKECMEMLKVTVKTTSDGALDRHLFKK